MLCQLSHCPTGDRPVREDRRLGCASPGLTGLTGHGHTNERCIIHQGAECTGSALARSNRRPARPTAGRRLDRPRQVRCEDGSMSMSTPTPAPPPPAPARLAADRRHRRVRDPGRRRQGQGAQGRRPSGDRLRGRRARLPDPRLHRRGGGRGGPRPAQPPLHPRRRAARAQAGDRRQDGRATRRTTSKPAQVLVTNGGKQAVYQAFATLLDPGDEVILPAPYWTTYPEAIRWPAACRSTCWPTRPRATWSPSSSSRRRAPTATKALLFCSPSNPTGAVYPPRAGPRDRAVGARARHLGGHRRDLRAPDRTATPSSARSWSRCPSSPTPAWCSTASPRPTR